MTKIFKKAYRLLIVGRKEEISFWILSTFLPTFIVARVLINLFPDLAINIRGNHIHHLAWGIILLAVTGYLSLTVQRIRIRRWIAALYGVGLTLAFDEFAMWLRLEDIYWDRLSTDVILVLSALLINFVYFGNFWLYLFRHLFGFPEE